SFRIQYREPVLATSGSQEKVVVETNFSRVEKGVDLADTIAICVVPLCCIVDEWLERNRETISICLDAFPGSYHLVTTDKCIHVDLTKRLVETSSPFHVHFTVSVFTFCECTA